MNSENTTKECGFVLIGNNGSEIEFHPNDDGTVDIVKWSESLNGPHTIYTSKESARIMWKECIKNGYTRG